MAILNAKQEDVVAVLREAVQMTETKIKQLESKADEVLPKIMEVGKYPNASDYSLHAGYEFKVNLARSDGWFKTRQYYGSEKLIESVSALDERKAALLALVDKMQADNTAVELQYEAALANNLAIHTKVGLLMEHIGFKPSYSVRDFKSRSQYPKYITEIAGYKKDLAREVPVRLQGAKDDGKQLRSAIEQQYQKIVQQVQQKEREEQQKREVVQRQHKIALLRAKYTPDDALSSEYAIRDEILAKNKYLALAYFLEKNRGDWSDGYSYAEQGLDWFSVETGLDQEIQDEIQALIDDWGGDGRCFRDCKYNYNALYAMVEDEQLIKDIELLK